MHRKTFRWKKVTYKKKKNCIVINICQFRMCSYLFKDSLGDLFVLMPGYASKRQLVANDGNFTDFSNTVYNAEIEQEKMQQNVIYKCYSK